MSEWLRHVQDAIDQLPDWIGNVLTHSKFANLDRQAEGNEELWRIVTFEELEFRAPTLRQVCDQFTEHYKVKP